MKWALALTALLLIGCSDGRRVTRYADGTVWAEIVLVDGIPQGTWRTFYPDGTPKSVGRYLDGRRTGTWLTWHPDGKMHSRGNYIEGRHDGLWEYWFDTGSPASSGTYVDGHLVGTWRWWYGTGTLRSEMHYDDTGELEGISRKYWPTGGIELETRFEHGLRVAERATAEDGRVRWEGAFENGKRTGPWRTWFRDGRYNQALSGIYAEDVKVSDLPETPTRPEERFEL